MVNNEKRNARAMNDAELEKVTGGGGYQSFDDIIAARKKQQTYTVEEGMLYQNLTMPQHYAMVNTVGAITVSFRIGMDWSDGKIKETYFSDTLKMEEFIEEYDVAHPVDPSRWLNL